MFSTSRISEIYINEIASANWRCFVIEGFCLPRNDELQVRFVIVRPLGMFVFKNDAVGRSNLYERIMILPYVGQVRLLGRLTSVPSHVPDL